MVKTKKKIDLSLIMISIPFIPTLSLEIRIDGNFEKRGTLKPFDRASQKFHAHLHVIGFISPTDQPD